jgi:hypothetical protein
MTLLFVGGVMNLPWVLLLALLVQATLADMLKQSRWTMMGVVALVVIIVWFSIAKRTPFLKVFTPRAYAAEGLRSHRPSVRPTWFAPDGEPERAHQRCRVELEARRVQ